MRQSFIWIQCEPQDRDTLLDAIEEVSDETEEFELKTWEIEDTWPEGDEPIEW
jgi:hypothetical protein